MRVFSVFLLIFAAAAGVARLLWKDSGKAFELVVDRWGAGGGVIMLAVLLAVCGAVLLLQHA